jgi:hypothetical protein
LGKTSLLNAGVAPRLRAAGLVPLFLRVNDPRRSPVASILAGIRTEAERQQIEYEEHDTDSLWSFLKTVEFWRGDVLQTPALIFDQFEELFTLQSEEFREALLSELSYLIRAVPPPSVSEAVSKKTAPSIRIVISLREDFLGTLEEAADQIPEIMDHRFRLAPLNLDAAREAIRQPAAVSDPVLATKPFDLDPDLVAFILSYLTRSGRRIDSPAGLRVEPFQLQLICQRIEQTAARKQASEVGKLNITLADIGGEGAMRETLESFYDAAIRSLQPKYLRPAARRLCEEFLISPEGRRLSANERELQRQLGLPRAVLNQLLERRLLRIDRRSESAYYELSHDSLIEPVLRSRRAQALFKGWTRIAAGGSIFVATGFLGILFSIALPYQRAPLSYYLILLPAYLCSTVFGLGLLRAGIDSRRRYRQASVGSMQALPILLPLNKRLVQWSIQVIGSILCIFWGAFAILTLAELPISIIRRKAFLYVDANYLSRILDRPLLEISWLIFEISVCIVFSWLVFRQGDRIFQSNEGFHEAVNSNKAILNYVRCLVGAFGASIGITGLIMLFKCPKSGRTLLSWLYQNLAPTGFRITCEALHGGGRINAAGFLQLWSFGFFLIALISLSIVLLRVGIRQMLSRNWAGKELGPSGLAHPSTE